MHAAPERRDAPHFSRRGYRSCSDRFRGKSSKPQPSGHETETVIRGSEIADPPLQTSDHGCEIIDPLDQRCDHGFQNTDHEREMSDHGSEIVDPGGEKADHGREISDPARQMSDPLLQTRDPRPQIVSQVVETSKRAGRTEQPALRTNGHLHGFARPRNAKLGVLPGR